jgi:hypothetical protein
MQDLTKHGLLLLPGTNRCLSHLVMYYLHRKQDPDRG